MTAAAMAAAAAAAMAAANDADAADGDGGDAHQDPAAAAMAAATAAAAAAGIRPEELFAKMMGAAGHQFMVPSAFRVGSAWRGKVVPYQHPTGPTETGGFECYAKLSRRACW